MVRLVALTTLAASLAAANAFTLSAWSSRDFTGSQFQTSRTGTFNVGFKAQSYKFSTFPGDGCCVKFCDGGRETGSRCGSFSNPSVLPQNRFNKVVLGCGSTVLNCCQFCRASTAWSF